MYFLNFDFDCLKRFYKTLPILFLVNVLLCNAQNNDLKTITHQIEHNLESYNTQAALRKIDSVLVKNTISKETIFLKVLKVETLIQANLLENALELSEEILNSPRLSSTHKVRLLLKRALIYELIDEFKNCKKQLDDIKAYYDNLNNIKDRNYGEYLFRFSSYYRVQYKIDSALYYAKKSKQFGDESHYIDASSVSSMLLAFMSDTYKEAKIHLNDAVTIWKKTNNNHGLSAIYCHFANIYYDEKKYSVALKYCDTAVSCAKKLYFHNDMLSLAYNKKSKCFEKLNNADSALFYFKLYSEERIEENRIHQKLEISEYELRKTELQKNSYLETAEIQARNNKNLIVFIIVLILLILIILKLLRRQRKNNIKISEQKNEIALTNSSLVKLVDEKELLYRELNHRVKNNLALIMSLIEFQSSEVSDEQYATEFEKLKGRVGSIAIVQNEYLIAENTEVEKKKSVRHYIEGIADALISVSTKRIKFNAEIENIILPIEKAVPIGILVNELISNTIKHAQTSSGEIVITIKLVKYKDDIQIIYNDNGSKFEDKNNSSSMGMFIIESMIAQLSGALERIKSHYNITLRLN